MTYTTRKDAAEACRYEAAAAERFSSAAIMRAEKGETSSAWSMADMARTAARCAMQAHEDLWDLVGENMTGAEFEVFEKAEIAQTDAGRAERAAAEAVKKLNEAHRLTKDLEEICDATGTRKEGIEALIEYYTGSCGWTETQAIAHIKKLFADGVIEQIKRL